MTDSKKKRVEATILHFDHIRAVVANVDKIMSDRAEFTESEALQLENLLNAAAATAHAARNELFLKAGTRNANLATIAGPVL